MLSDEVWEVGGGSMAQLETGRLTVTDDREAYILNAHCTRQNVAAYLRDGVFGHSPDESGLVRVI